ncbi:hypothetical protein BJX70DRAFT_364605 [Aspergillus crustosus]
MLTLLQGINHPIRVLMVEQCLMSHRHVVYSPIAKRTLWVQDSVRQFQTGCGIPVQIGKNVLYFVDVVGNGYRLSAYDFRAEKLLYHSPKHSVPQFQEQPHTLHDYFHVFRANGKKELVVASVISCVGRDNSAIHESETPEINLQIINGETGEQIYNVTCPEDWEYSFQAIPISNSFSLTLRPSRPPLSKTEDSFAISQKFFYQGRKASSLSPLSPDIVLFHNKTSDEWLYKPYIIDYQSLTVLSSGFAEEYRNDRRRVYGCVKGYALITTKDRRSLDLAERVLRRAYPQTNPPSLGQCFVLEEGVQVTLPARLGFRPNRVNFEHWFTFSKHGQLTDKGLVLLKAGVGIRLLEF